MVMTRVSLIPDEIRIDSHCIFGHSWASWLVGNNSGGK